MEFHRKHEDIANRTRMHTDGHGSVFSFSARPRDTARAAVEDRRRLHRSRIRSVAIRVPFLTSATAGCALHEVEAPTGNDACDETKNSKPKTQPVAMSLRLCVSALTPCDVLVSPSRLRVFVVAACDVSVTQTLGRLGVGYPSRRRLPCCVTKSF